MKRLERLDFFNEFGISPSNMCRLKEGDKISLKDGRTIKCKAVKGSIANPSIISFSVIPSVCHYEEETEYELDLMPHWERGTAEFELCHEGVINLIHGVYAQTEADYEKLYIGGAENYPLEKLPGENLKEFAARLHREHKKAIADCEEFLGEVYVKYARIKALWSVKHDIDYIAIKLHEKPDHIACIVDRLGLNQTETAQNETEIY